MTGVPPVLLDHVDEQTLEGDLGAVAEVSGGRPGVCQCGLHRLAGSVNSVGHHR